MLKKRMDDWIAKRTKETGRPNPIDVNFLKDGKLYKEASRDHDFVFLVLTAICSCVDEADLNKRPKQLVKYFKLVGSRAIKHHVRDSNRLKRKHEDVDIMDSDLVTDFYGQVAAN